MKLLEAVLAEYRKIEDVPVWSDAEKAAARAILRGVAVSAGVYGDFSRALKNAPSQSRPDIRAQELVAAEQCGQPFGGFIRF